MNMGSTGAAVAAAQLFVGRLPGVRRPGHRRAVPAPGRRDDRRGLRGEPGGERAEDLYQYAIMARLYARSALGVAEPRIGILSIGEEEHKGNQLVHETWALFRERGVPPFVGNVEPREFFQDKADVVVTDGFAGNVALKAAEGMAEYLLCGAPGGRRRAGTCSRRGAGRRSPRGSTTRSTAARRCSGVRGPVPDRPRAERRPAPS